MPNNSTPPKFIQFLKMNLIFRKGYKDWETTYEVEFDFEYSSDMKKRITGIILYCHDIKQRIAIPWHIFEEFLAGKTDGIFANPSGLRIKSVNGGLHISNGHFLNLLVHRDQIMAIKTAAKNITEDISTSVENILSEFAVQNPQV